MKLSHILFLLLGLINSAIACDGNIEGNIKNGGGEVKHIVKANKIKPDSSVLFYTSNSADEHPNIIAAYSPDSCSVKNIITFDTYGFNGTVANVESVFWGKGKYNSTFFVIVSWDYNLDGIKTVGKYYSVLAYDNNEYIIKKNNQLTELFGEGTDGFIDGEKTNYKYKTAHDVLVFLKSR